jgi:major membrane immunogen (membrane-anchored lipoprotein)
MIRKLIIGALALVALLSGCNVLELGNPFVGTWTGEALGPISYSFASDMTFVEEGEDFWTGETYSDPGTYAYTDERLTLTYEDGGVVEMLYEFRDDTLVLDPVSGISIGLVLTLQD